MDDLHCPYCGKEHDEDFIEERIRRSFTCDNCEGKVLVLLNIKSYVYLAKRVNRMKRYNEKKQRERDAVYLNKIKEQYITEVNGRYSEELSNLFFKNGNYKWVKKARGLFIEDARMLGIATHAIVEYFKENGGLIDYRTVNGYTNNY